MESIFLRWNDSRKNPFNAQKRISMFMPFSIFPERKGTCFAQEDGRLLQMVQV